MWQMDHNHSASWDHNLAILCSIFDSLPLDLLLATLKRANGNLQRAVDLCLETPKKCGLKQLEISEFFGTKRLQLEPTHQAAPQPSLNNTLRWLPSPCSRLPPRKEGHPTLFLYNPNDVEANTPCQLIFNALPKDLAESILRLTLKEAKDWKRNEWWLFERQVKSPHTSCFYVADFWRNCYENGRGEYYYNGAKIDKPRYMPPEMEEVRQIAQRIVNEKMSARERHPFEVHSDWIPNVAAANCYSSSEESVGWHSDKLSYLGPRPTIASLSLGVTRQFRVRQILPTQIGGAEASGRIISIALPHNSLLIMNPPFQEQWKHEIPSQPTLDPHSIAGTVRINLTFRAYRPEYSPRYTPLCHCGVPCVLRAVQKRNQNIGRYFYKCDAGGQQIGRFCNYFQWVDPLEKASELWAGENVKNDKKYE